MIGIFAMSLANELFDECRLGAEDCVYPEDYGSYIEQKKIKDFTIFLLKLGVIPQDKKHLSIILYIFKCLLFSAITLAK